MRYAIAARFALGFFEHGGSLKTISTNLHIHTPIGLILCNIAQTVPRCFHPDRGWICTYRLQLTLPAFLSLLHKLPGTGLVGLNTNHYSRILLRLQQETNKHVLSKPLKTTKNSQSHGAGAPDVMNHSAQHEISSIIRNLQITIGSLQR